MKLFLYDKCYDAILDLPKVIQKKVMDFQRKFREDSKSAAINLESIHNFKDASLRTARIDGKYRAVIKVPESGDNYYLLWVDNHDEAMDWAKNKIFAWNDNTQSMQIFSAPEAVEIAAQQADAHPIDYSIFQKYTEEQLTKLGVPTALMPSVRSVVDLSDLEKIEQNLPIDAFENLFYLADGADYDNLIRDITSGTVASKDLTEQVNSANNKRSFIELTDDDTFNELLSGSLHKWQLFLHPSQRKLVEGNFNGSVKVSGGAGTGKTVAALHRLKYLSNNDLEQPILFTTYTRALTTNLETLISKMDVSKDKYRLFNIDALAKNLALDNDLINKDTRILDFPNSKTSEELWNEVLENRLSTFDWQFLNSEYQDIILYNSITTKDAYFQQTRIGRGRPLSRKQRMDVWQLFECYQTAKTAQNLVDRSELFNRLSAFYTPLIAKPFSHIIADEVQDLSNVELRFLRALTKEQANDLFLVGDPMQTIYARKINFTAIGINIRGTRSKRLRINYRTTEEIKKLAISVIQDIAFDNFDGEAEAKNGYLSLFHGEKPEYRLFKTKEEETDYLVDAIRQVQQARISLSEIAIASRTKEGCKEVKTALHYTKIPFIDLSSAALDKDSVRITTFHNLKGLEFKVVILCDVNNRSCPFLPYVYPNWSEEEQKSHLKGEKSLLYVAITRAIQKVIISGTGIKSDCIN
jgi:hypothetical protein